MSRNNEIRDDAGRNHSFHPGLSLFPQNRRSTILFGTTEGRVEVYEDPNNPPHVNASLRREYESIKELNVAVESAIDSVEELANMVKAYTETTDRTETLLKMWAEILARAGKTQETIEASWNPSPPVFKKPDPVRNRSSGTNVRRRRIFRSQK